MFSQNNFDPIKFKNYLLGLRGALPYLEEFHDEIFVIKVSGSTLLQPNLPAILDDLILLARIGINIVIVHGANPQIQQAIASQGAPLLERDNRFVIEEAHLASVSQAIATTNWELISKLSRFERDILPFSGHFVQAQRYAFSSETPTHCVGEVCDINAKALQSAIDQHFLPIIPPFAIGEKGRLWVLDPNQVALEVSVRLRARKLIILNTENYTLPGLKDHNIRTTTDNMKLWLAQAANVKMETLVQIQTLIEACERGVERCHWLNSSIDGVMLGELLTSVGTGIMITNSAYERVRYAKLNDIHKIAQILEKPTNDLVLVHKSLTYLENHIDNFLVFCIDEELAGCCELIYYEDSKSMEIASLAVKQEFRNRGIAKQLLAFGQSEAQKKKIALIFALTTQASHVFVGNGFKEIPPEHLPHTKRKNYDFSDSLIYGKFLS